ncbi:MAG TPA: hypothetical protein VFU15_01280 [Bacteroidia bacterium]|nr:hypothetical protein [Bacteroidia bacterium]
MKAALRSLFCILLLPAITFAQVNTRNDGNDNPPKAPNGKTKVLIIPWEPITFNVSSDVSRAISNETGQKYDQIEESLRKGLVDQLKKSFGPTCSVTSLLDDTAKMKKDLRYTYVVTQRSYTPVNFPLNPTKADSAKLNAPKQGTSNGQIQTTDDETDKFMNCTVLSPNLLGYLHAKYGADYIIFINEIDIDNNFGADPYNTQGKTDYVRDVVVHWTIYSATTEKRVAAGKSKGTFSSATNTPSKISSGAFSAIAKDIYSRYLAGIKPKK